MPYYSELGIYASPTSGYPGVYVPGPYSNHSSIIAANFIRTPPSLRNFRGYKPHLTTISEAQSPLRRINSPKILLRSTAGLATKPIKKINTADIDVSVNKYRKYERTSNNNNNNDKLLERKSPSPTSEQKEAKPSTTIRRDRATIRIQTIHKDMVPGGNAVRSWRDNFHPNELKTEEEKRPKKSPGELLKEKFLIRSNDENFLPEKKITRRASKKLNVQKTPSFHDICTAITTNQIDEELNPGQPLEIQRRQSRQFSTEDLLVLSRNNSAGDVYLVKSVIEEPEQKEFESRSSVKKKKKTTKKKSNERLVLPSTEIDSGNKSGIQRRPTQKKIRRTSTDSSIGSDIVDAEVEKAYQEAIRDISHVEIESISNKKPKPVITATIDIEEKPCLKAVVDNVEVVESPKPKKTSKFKFNVIVEEIEDNKIKNLKKLKKNTEEHKGVVNLPKAKNVIVSNLLNKNQNGHIGHVLEDINETPKKENEANVQNNNNNDIKSNVKKQTEIKKVAPKTIFKSKSEDEPVKVKNQFEVIKDNKSVQKSSSTKTIENNKENKNVNQIEINNVKSTVKIENEKNKSAINQVKELNEVKEIQDVKKIEQEKPLEVNKIKEKPIEIEKIIDIQTLEVAKPLQVKKIEENQIIAVPKPVKNNKIEEIKKVEIKKNNVTKNIEVIQPIELQKIENVTSKKIEEIKKIESVEPVEERTVEENQKILTVKPVEIKKAKEITKIEPIEKVESTEKSKKIEESHQIIKPTTELESVKKIKAITSPNETIEQAINKTKTTIPKKQEIQKSKSVDTSEIKSPEAATVQSKLEPVPKLFTQQVSNVLKKKIEKEAPKPNQTQPITTNIQSENQTSANVEINNKNTPENTNDGKILQLEKQMNLIKDEKLLLQLANLEKTASGENFWATIGPRESVYVTRKISKPKIEENDSKVATKNAQKEVNDASEKPSAPDTPPVKKLISKRSLVNKSFKEDPDLVVFIPPEPEPEPEPKPESDTFVPLQSNRLSQFMHPFKKPEQFDECPVEIFARPKTIRKRHYPRPRHAPPPTAAPVTVQENEDEEEEESSESEEEESSSSAATTSTDDEYDVNVVYSSKVGASTSSNDSGFDSGVPGSRNKDCDVNCHKKCEKLTANLCGVNQKLIVEAIESVRKGSSESRDSPTSNPSHNPAFALDSAELLEEYAQSSTFAGFQKSGRITPPATTIPRFRKYAVEDFNFLKVLGKGSFGKVLLAELKDTEYYYAIKCLKKDVVLEDDDVECTLIERKVLALATKHPYLCHLLCTFQTQSHLFFVMEYLNGGDLMFHIQQSGRFPEARARFYGAEIVSGLKFLHNKGIVYRDLKLDNILLDFDGHVRIADFGMCKLQIFLDRMADTFCGTPDYMAPEIIKGQHYNQCVDWWSFGVLLYEMLIGQSPFSGCDEDELFWSICNEKPVIPRFLTTEASTILLLFLEKDANKRLGNRFCPSGDIQDQPFFKPIQWDRLEARQLEAPFKPNLQHPLDTQYFDKTFTVEKAKLTPIETNILQSMDQTQFQGFSYTNPNATDK